MQGAHVLLTKVWKFYSTSAIPYIHSPHSDNRSWPPASVLDKYFQSPFNPYWLNTNHSVTMARTNLSGGVSHLNPDQGKPRTTAFARLRLCRSPVVGSLADDSRQYIPLGPDTEHAVNELVEHQTWPDETPTSPPINARNSFCCLSDHRRSFRFRIHHFMLHVSTAHNQMHIDRRTCNPAKPDPR